MKYFYMRIFAGKAVKKIIKRILIVLKLKKKIKFIKTNLRSFSIFFSMTIFILMIRVKKFNGAYKLKSSKCFHSIVALYVLMM